MEVSISKERIGERIAHLRKVKGWNQAELGKLIDRDIAGVSRLETGGNFPGLAIIARCSMLFEVSMDFLTFGKNWSGSSAGVPDEVLKMLVSQIAANTDMLKEVVGV